MKQTMLRLVACALVLHSLLSLSICAQKRTEGLDDYNETPSRLRSVIDRFEQDYGALNRWYSAPYSTNRAQRMTRLYSDELALVTSFNFDSLNHDEQVDYLLFKNYLDHEQKELARSQQQISEMSALIPFAHNISDLEDSRRRMETMDPAKAASTLNELAKQVAETQRSFESVNTAKPKRTVASRAACSVVSLRNTLKNWFNFYNGYDPMFSWWNSDPYKAADDALGKYTAFINEKLVGIRPDDKTTIIGDPIGREAFMEELRYEMIPYSPEELVEIANKEFAWCETEMKKASREMGYGDDWKKALEVVKQKYVEPGKQPELIKRLAIEATDFVEKNNLVTVPQLAKETWRMEMMSPERQLVAPFFLGGETILLACT